MMSSKKKATNYYYHINDFYAGHTSKSGKFLFYVIHPFSLWIIILNLNSNKEHKKK